MQDVTDLYDQNLGANDEPQEPTVQAGPGPKATPPAPGGFESLLKYHRDTKGQYQTYGNTFNVDSKDYVGYIPEGIRPDVRNIDFQRGERQSAWDKWGNMVAGIIPKIGTSLVESAGYLGSLATEFGDERDYTNALTEWSKSATSWIDENLPMYRKSADTFALGDATWWTQNIQGLAVSASAFALQGGLIGKALGSIAGGVQKIGAARAVANAGAKVLTAAELAYTEGAMSGKSVYDKAYEYQLRQNILDGDDAETAHKKATKIASQSAASTVQLNTTINTVLNLGMLKGYFGFHDANKVKDFWAKHGKIKPGETVDDALKRVQAYDAADKTLRKQFIARTGTAAVLSDAGFEGVEELVNQFAERTGEHLGRQRKGNDGVTKGFLEQLGELEHFVDRTMDAEGGLAFLLGAVGGLAQGQLLSRMPTHQITTDTPLETKGSGDREFKKSWVSTRAKQAFFDTKYFNNVREVVEEDLKTIQDYQGKAQGARAAGNHILADHYLSELANLGNYNAVQTGMAGNYQEMYRQMAEVDNYITEKSTLETQLDMLRVQAAKATDAERADLEQQIAVLEAKLPTASEQTAAMKLGLAKDKNDFNYQKKAQEAIDDIAVFQKIHDDVAKRFEFEDDPTSKRLADIISTRSMDLYSQKKRLKSLRDELADQERAIDEVHAAATPDLLERATIKSVERIRQLEEIERSYVDKFNIVASAINAVRANPEDETAVAVLEDLFRHYGIIGLNGDALVGAVKDLQTTLERRAKIARDKRVEEEEKVFSETQFKQWHEKYPDKSFDDYQKEVYKKSGLTDELGRMKYLENELNDRVEELSRNLLEIKKESRLKKLKEKADKLYADMAKKTHEQNIQVRMRQDKEAAQLRTNELKRLRVLNKLLNEKIDEIYETFALKEKVAKQLAAVLEEIVEYEDSVVLHTRSLNPAYHKQLLVRKFRMEERIKALDSKLSYLYTLFHDYETQMREMVEEVRNNPKKYTAYMSEAEMNKFIKFMVFMGKKFPGMFGEWREFEDTTVPTDLIEEKPIPREDLIEDEVEAAVRKELADPENSIDDRTADIAAQADNRPDVDYIPETTPEREVSELLVDPEAVEEELAREEAEADPTPEIPPEVENTEPETDDVDLSEEIPAERTPEENLYLTMLGLVPQNTRLRVIAMEQKVKRAIKKSTPFTRLQNLLDESTHEFYRVTPDPTDTDEKLIRAWGDYLESYYHKRNDYLAKADELKSLTPVKEMEKIPDDFDDNLDVKFSTDTQFSMGPITEIDPEEISALGAKTTSSLKIQQLMIDYVEFFNEDKMGYEKSTLIDQVNENVPREYVDGSLKPKFKVRLEIDTSFIGPVNVDTELRFTDEGYRQQVVDAFTNYTETGTIDGKIKEGGYLDVPIKIVSVASGETLGYVMRHSWLHAKYPDVSGPEAYRNFAAYRRQEDGTLVDQLTPASTQLEAVRKKIVDEYNNGNTKGLETQISFVGPGTPVLNREVNLNTERRGKITPRSTADMLTNPKLKLAVIDKKSSDVIIGNSEDGYQKPQVEVNAAKDLSNYAGKAGVLLPMADGTLYFAPIVARPLYSEKGGKAGFNTIVGLIELFLQSQSENEEISNLAKAQLTEIKERTGYDVLTPAGLASLSGNYFTYFTRGMTFNKVKEAYHTEKRSTTLFFEESTNPVTGKTQVRFGYGEINSGIPGYEIKLDASGKIPTETVDALRRYIGSRSRAVAIRKNESDATNFVYAHGINTREQVTVPLLTTKGTWTFRTYPTYNDFIKENSETIYRELKIKDQFVYSVHPEVDYDPVPLIGKPEVVVETENTSTEVTTEDTETPSDSPGALDSIFSDDENFQKTVIVDQIKPSVQNLKPVSFEALEELYNFTPLYARNGKTILQVLEELKNLGIPVLVDGYNPFSRCL